MHTYRAANCLSDQLVQHQDGMHIHPTENEWASGAGQLSWNHVASYRKDKKHIAEED
jgi:hypothetical protein